MEKHCRMGQKVTVQGKEGIVMEIGDKTKVKFTDGSFGFFADNEITLIVAESALKHRIFDRMKAEGQLKPDQVLMTTTATGTDPLAQPKRKTGRTIGENQNVLGKEISQDIFRKGLNNNEDIN